MKKLRSAVFALVTYTFVLPMFGASGSAFVADLARDWSSTVNGNNGWKYSAGNAPLAFQQNWLGFPAWAAGQVAPNLSPAVLKLDSADVIGGVLDFQSNDVGILSGDPQSSGNAGAANIMWTGSVAGTIEIRGRVWNAEIAAPRDSQYIIKLNGIVLTSGMINHLVDTRAHPVVIAQNATVHAADVVEMDFVKPATQERGSFAGHSPRSVSRRAGSRYWKLRIAARVRSDTLWSIYRPELTGMPFSGRRCPAVRIKKRL